MFLKSAGSLSFLKNCASSSDFIKNLFAHSVNFCNILLLSLPISQHKHCTSLSILWLCYFFPLWFNTYNAWWLPEVSHEAETSKLIRPFISVFSLCSSSYIPSFQIPTPLCSSPLYNLLHWGLCSFQYSTSLSFVQLEETIQNSLLLSSIYFQILLFFGYFPVVWLMTA